MTNATIEAGRTGRLDAVYATHVPPDGMTMTVRGNWRSIGVNSWQLPVQATDGETWQDGNLIVEFYPGGDQVIRAFCLAHDGLGHIGNNAFHMSGPDQPFEPVVSGRPGDETYWDGSVSAALGLHENGVQIYEWSSVFTGKGRTTRALEWLKSTYGQVAAISVGEIDEDGNESPTIGYWRHMRDKGLVDFLVLDDGTELEPNPDNAPAPR